MDKFWHHPARCNPYGVLLLSQQKDTGEAQYNKWKDKGLVVLGINLGEAEVTVQGFVNQYGLTFPILYDPNLQIRNRYRVTQYPTTFFIKKGKIEIVQIGQMQESFLENAIQSLMTE